MRRLCAHACVLLMLLLDAGLAASFRSAVARGAFMQPFIFSLVLTCGAVCIFTGQTLRDLMDIVGCMGGTMIDASSADGSRHETDRCMRLSLPG